MGKASKALKEFIDGIPDSKVKGITEDEHTIYKDKDFRLDMQGLTSGKPKKYNLQVQVNNETGMKREKGKTVATAIVPVDPTWTPDQIRAELHENSKL